MTSQNTDRQPSDERRKEAQEKLESINSSYSANPVKWAVGIGAVVLAIALVFGALFATGVISVQVPEAIDTPALTAAVDAAADGGAQGA